MQMQQWHQGLSLENRPQVISAREAGKHRKEDRQRHADIKETLGTLAILSRQGGEISVLVYDRSSHQLVFEVLNFYLITEL